MGGHEEKERSCRDALWDGAEVEDPEGCGERDEVPPRTRQTRDPPRPQSEEHFDRHPRDSQGQPKLRILQRRICSALILTLGPAQVADFGISQNQTQSNLHARNEAGTLHFMAPELLSNGVYNEKVRKQHH